MVGFLFGGDTGETAETIKRKRAVLNAMAAKSYAPKNVGEGIAAIGDALGYRMQDSALRKQEAEGVASTAGPLAAIGASLQGPSAFPPAPSGAGGAPASAATMPQSAEAGKIRQGLIDRGLPEHVADGFLMNFKDESGFDPGINEKNPTVPGSRGGFGLYQLTGPRRTAYEQFAGQRGVDPSNVDAQLDFLMTELQGPEARAAKSIMATKDAGSAASAIARDFLRPAQEHLNSRIARYMAAGGSSAPVEYSGAGLEAAGKQVASLDPSIGLQETGAMQPANVARPQAVQPAIQVAQALQRGPNGKTAEEEIMGRAVNPSAGPSMQQLMEAASNPWMNDNQSGVINALMRQKLQEMDPATALERRKLELELRNLENPVGDPFTLGEGQTRYDASGNLIAKGAEKSAAKPSAVQEYEYAKGQGFPGTFQDWEASKKGGMSLQVDPATGAVSFQQGGNIKPMTEGQSKDAVFSTRAEGALPLIDKFGDALTSLPETVGGQIPVVGNYAKSSEYQQAEQAGKEFLQAILRKDTGAAITPQETAEYGSVYLPRPGDGPELLAQKKASRTRALEAIKAGMPPQAILAQEKALANTKAATPEATQNKKKPVVIDGYHIEEAD